MCATDIPLRLMAINNAFGIGCFSPTRNLATIEMTDLIFRQETKLTRTSPGVVTWCVNLPGACIETTLQSLINNFTHLLMARAVDSSLLNIRAEHALQLSTQNY